MHIVVAGAGIIGLTTAVELRCRGHRVTVISPGVATEATHAAAGMLAPASEVQYGQDLLYPLMLAAAQAWPAMAKRIEALSGQPSGFRDNPTLLVAADRADLQRIRDTAAVQQRHGMRVEPLTSRELARREPALAPGLAGGFTADDDHQVDPRVLCRSAVAALLAPADQARPAPVATLVPARVLAVRQDGGRVLVETDDPAVGTSGTLAADAVVLATGLAHDDVDGDPRRQPLALRPVHGDVLRLRVPERLREPGANNLLTATIRGQVAGRPVYLVPRADDELVLGATSREDGTSVTVAGGVLDLLADATLLCPAVRECELREVTTRARPGTPDDLPYLGQLADAPRVVVSTGYFRHGILLSGLASRLGADLAEAAGRGEPHRPAAGSPDEKHLAATALSRHHTAPVRED